MSGVPELPHMVKLKVLPRVSVTSSKAKATTPSEKPSAPKKDDKKSSASNEEQEVEDSAYAILDHLEHFIEHQKTDNKEECAKSIRGVLKEVSNLTKIIGLPKYTQKILEGLPNRVFAK